MCTKPRIIAPQVFYEVTSRGNPELNIFQNPDMKHFFLKELKCTIKKYSFQCFAWSIMKDHYHLIVKSSEISISKFMQRLNSNFARHFNKNYKRKGTVFYRRFASAIAQEENTLKELIRYVHLNPVRSKECSLEELDRYQWCGHHTVINRITDGLIDTKDFLVHFGISDPLKSYQDFIRTKEIDSSITEKVRAIHDGKQSIWEAGRWIIGDKKFIQKIINIDRSNRTRIARYIRENVNMNTILDRLKLCTTIDNKNIVNQGRLSEVSTARQLFAIIGHYHYEFSCTALGRFLKVSGSAVSKMISRGERIVGLDYLKQIISLA